MILELGLVALGGYMYHELNTKEEKELKRKFNQVMSGIGLYNKKDETFSLSGLRETKYGWRGNISIPSGLSLSHIESKKNILEDNLNGIIEIEKDRFKEYINFYMINRDVDKFLYEPVKCKNNELYIGKDFKLNNFKLDVRKDAHVLIGGCTGTGKSFLLAIILANLIYNSSDSIEIFLLQIAKSELSAFDNCPCVKKACYNINDCNDALIEIMNEVDNRSNKFKERGIRNIAQWNTHFKKEFMKEIYVVIEELSFFNDCEDIVSLSKVGRSVGIHIISCIQRSVATEMNPTLKSQMTRITFRQKSSIDSSNIINTPDAKYLKERECIVDGNNDYIQLKTAWVDEDYILLHKYVPDIRIPTKKKSVKDKIIQKQKEALSDVIVDLEKKEVRLLESHGLIDVEEDEITEEITTIKTIKKNNSNKNKKQTKKNEGVISLEEYENAKRKR